MAVISVRKRTIDWLAAAQAGLVAGVAIFAGMVLLLPVLGYASTPWAIPRVVAAMMAGPGALFSGEMYGTGAMLGALVLHLTLSLLYAVTLSALILRAGPTAGIVTGIAFGAAIYFLNFHVFTYAFPWFAEARSPVAFGLHLLYGGTAALAYKALARSEVEQGDLALIRQGQLVRVRPDRFE